MPCIRRRSAPSLLWCAVVVAAVLVATPVAVRAAFGFEFECGRSGVLTSDKSNSKWVKAVISATPPGDYQNGVVRETIDDAPYLHPDKHYNYFRLEYVVGGPHGMAVTSGFDLCPTLQAFASAVNVRWLHSTQQCCASTSKSTARQVLSYAPATAYNPTTGVAIGPVSVAMESNQCTPQVTVGIPHDSVFKWLQAVTTGVDAAQLALQKDDALADFTRSVNANVTAAIQAVNMTATTTGARLKALLWFVRRYVTAFSGTSPLMYLKQNTLVLMRTHFAALAHKLTEAEKRLLTALQERYRSANAAETLCTLAWGVGIRGTNACASRVVTGPAHGLSGQQFGLTVREWLTLLLANDDPFAHASGGSMGHIPYDSTSTLVVMEFRHTHTDASPATIAPWVWSVYDYVAQFIAHHGVTRGPAPVWNSTIASRCALPSETAQTPKSCGGWCSSAFVDVQTRLRRKALRRVQRAAARH